VVAETLPDEQWMLIGTCCIHGFMDWDCLRPGYEEKREMFWIK